MKKIAIIGHRGVGKSSFLNRSKIYFDGKIQNFFDLDEEISLAVKKPIADIFSTEGEAQFRSYEKQTFFDLYNRHSNFMISLGGGFPVEEIPQDVHCVWLQRLSDKSGRIFFDRPKLNHDVTDLEEFLKRAQQRDLKFKKRADECYLIPEGDVQSSKEFQRIERQIFSENISFQEGCFFTITESIHSKNQFLSKILDCNWEFRDDLLSPEQIQKVLSSYKPQGILISFRRQTLIRPTELLVEVLKSNEALNIKTDWALELGVPDNSQRFDIISLHDFLPGETLQQFLSRLEDFSQRCAQLKASPIIKNWSELRALWHWQQSDPERRSILPRSQDGRWAWLRLFQKGRQKINFWKDSEGSAVDQPSLFQWLSTPDQVQSFAAILGTPIHLSWTPIEQLDFFIRNKRPVLGIDLDEEEWGEAFPFLEKLGLSAAAVTSPLKKIALSVVESCHLSKEAQDLGALNTLNRKLVESQFHWFGTNTDIEGFRSLSRQANELLIQQGLQTRPGVAVWGGGGTLPVIKSVFPDCIEYSIRTRKTRNEVTEKKAIEILVWAAGPTADFPPEEIRPLLVIDLNYREDSNARAFAKNRKILFLSGEGMFKTQAFHQRKFWNNES